MPRNEHYKMVSATLGTSWDIAKALAKHTPLTASGFVRELIRRYGLKLKEDLEGKEQSLGGA